jgi:hypothetical protein
VLAKLATIERTVSPQRHEAINVSVDEVEVTDSIFWPGKTMRFKPSDMPSGLTAIIGGNGTGKSSLLAFCTPYPVIVGKDTDSGRQSAIKDFFDGPRAQFKKRVTYNGQKHEHIINVKGAHTKTPRVECALTADGVSKLDRGSWDEMFAECEQLYGPFADYLLTTFYVQPLQGKTSSSLMTATMTDIRDLVQSIAGINREPEKRHALDQKAAREKEIDQKRNWIEGATANLADIATLNIKRDEQHGEYDNADRDMKQAAEAVKSSSATLDRLTAAKLANDHEVQRKADDDAKRVKLTTMETVLKNDIDRYLAASANLPELQARADKQRLRDDALASNRQLKIDYDEKVIAYNQDLNALREQVRKHNADEERAFDEAKRLTRDKKDDLNFKIKRAQSTIDGINKPCKNCNWIDPKAQEEIDELNVVIKESQALLASIPIPSTVPPYPEPRELDRPLPTQPVYDPVPEIDGTLAETLTAISTATSAEANVKALRSQLSDIAAQQVELNAKTYTIDASINDKFDNAKTFHDDAQAEFVTASSAVATAKAQLENIDAQIKQWFEATAKIDAAREEIKSSESELTDWTYISGLFQANKLPAFELDQIAKTIDSSATRNIEPYRNAAYSFSTTTQDIGKDNKPIDRFQIMVHNNETGQSKSFLAHSPGEKAFLNDAYVKALIRIRNNRAQRVYSPIISDEADGPIEPGLVSAYYAMQTEFYRGEERVLIVSHAPDAHNYVQNHVEIKELLS